METINLKDSENWATYNIQFPLVKVKMKGKISSQEDFDNFTNEWLEVYNSFQKFTFIFDTTEVGFVSSKYAFKMGDFIRDLKRNRDNSFLERSIILTKSFWVRTLLKLIFFLESPVAPVYIVNVEKNIDIDKLITNIKIGNPIHKSISFYK
jgi:hypothetical protein